MCPCALIEFLALETGFRDLIRNNGCAKKKGRRCRRREGAGRRREAESILGLLLKAAVFSVGALTAAVLATGLQ